MILMSDVLVFAFQGSSHPQTANPTLNSMLGHPQVLQQRSNMGQLHLQQSGGNGPPGGGGPSMMSAGGSGGMTRHPGQMASAYSGMRPPGQSTNPGGMMSEADFAMKQQQMRQQQIRMQQLAGMRATPGNGAGYSGGMQQQQQQQQPQPTQMVQGNDIFTSNAQLLNSNWKMDIFSPDFPQFSTEFVLF